jgi:hypothetical protein
MNVKSAIQQLEQRAARNLIDVQFWSPHDIEAVAGCDFNGFWGGPIGWDRIVVSTDLPKHGKLYVLAHELGHAESFIREYKNGLYKPVKMSSKERYYFDELKAVYHSMRIFREEGIPLSQRLADYWWLNSLRNYIQRFWGKGNGERADEPESVVRHNHHLRSLLHG